MNLIKEPKEIDFLIQSEPWSESELADLRKIMNQHKTQNTTAKKVNHSNTKGKPRA